MAATNDLGPLLRARFEVASFLLKHPAAYYSLCRAGIKRRDLVVDRDTEVVIEGFPRSGNSFSVFAFVQAQARPVHVAHHHHAQAQIIAGVRRGIPVCALIRTPEDAVKSLVVRAPNVSVAYALRKYIRFYEDVYPYRDGFIVGPFEEVTTAFDRTIRRLNQRFNSDFVPFDHTEDSVARVFAEIDRINAEYNRGVEAVIAKPTEKKDRLKREVRVEESPGLLARAREVHARFLALVDSGGAA